MKLNDQVIVQKLGETYVAYDNNNSVLHEFNEVGYTILEQIEKGSSKDEVIVEIMEEYDVSMSQALEDVEEFLEVLVKKDVIAL